MVTWTDWQQKRIALLESENANLQEALVGLVGSDDSKELSAMIVALKSMSVPQEEREKTINAIDALPRGGK